MSPLHAKHVDSDGNTMSVMQTDGYSYKLTDWLRGLKIEPGDRIEFAALHVRKEEEEAPALSVVSA